MFVIGFWTPHSHGLLYCSFPIGVTASTSRALADAASETPLLDCVLVYKVVCLLSALVKSFVENNTQYSSVSVRKRMVFERKFIYDN